MAPFPLPLMQLLGKAGAYFIYLLIGFAFGYVLEISGFAYSPKLAAQFYFKEMTVLKVMFTAIVVAMVLIFAASGLGLLDYNLIWVNPTYLLPGILGGLIMGVGFIIGGFCPGTSLVALATLKVDGLFFALGTLFGIFLFGETVDFYDIFWHSTYMGRFTLPQWLGLSTGAVVIIVVLMALFMFWGAEQLERIFGGKDPKQAPRARYAGAAVLFLGAIAVWLIGQPTTADRWARIAPQKEPLLQERAVYIHPGELLDTMHDHQIKLVMLDVRSEADYNLFHIADARRVPLEKLAGIVSELHLEPENTVVVVMSNDETLATEGWKILVAESVPNVYILEGGINHWLEIFAKDENRIRPLSSGSDEQLRYEFAAALGAAFPAAEPHPDHYDIEYIPKIKLDIKRAPSGGGCG
jgi:rhodanese-related sulfurtransferase